MGWTPEQTAQQSLWQIAAAVDGWNRGHGGDRGETFTAADFYSMNPAPLIH